MLQFFAKDNTYIETIESHGFNSFKFGDVNTVDIQGDPEVYLGTVVYIYVEGNLVGSGMVESYEHSKNENMSTLLIYPLIQDLRSGFFHDADNSVAVSDDISNIVEDIVEQYRTDSNNPILSLSNIGIDSTGLVALYDGSGVDVTGNLNDGAGYGVVSYGEDAYGNYAEINGSRNHGTLSGSTAGILIGNKMNFTQLTDFSWSSTFSIITNPPNNASGVFGSSFDSGITISNSSGAMYVGLRGSTQVAVNIGTNYWNTRLSEVHTVGFKYIASTNRFYVYLDGILQNSGGTVGPTTFLTNDWRFGDDSLNGWNTSSCRKKVYRATVFSRALSDEEMQRLTSPGKWNNPLLYVKEKNLSGKSLTYTFENQTWGEAYNFLVDNFVGEGAGVIVENDGGVIIGRTPVIHELTYGNDILKLSYEKDISEVVNSITFTNGALINAVYEDANSIMTYGRRVLYIKDERFLHLPSVDEYCNNILVKKGSAKIKVDSIKTLRSDMKVGDIVTISNWEKNFDDNLYINAITYNKDNTYTLDVGTKESRKDLLNI